MDLWQSIGGMLTAQLESADTGGAISQICDLGITLYDLTELDALNITFRIRRSDFARLRALCRRKGYHLTILRGDGLYWKLRSLVRRPVLLLGILFYLVLGIWLSGRVLFVRIEGNETIPQRQILETAQQCGIGFGAVRREVRSEKMKNALLEAMPQLQWAGINTKGCVAVISVKERQTVTQKEGTSGVSSIVASRDGVITELTVTKGNPSCKVGQAVKAGQTLISGYTDCGIAIRGERAEGEVYAVTQRQVEAVTPTLWQIRGKVKAVHKKYSLIIGKKQINLSEGSGISYTGCVKMYEENYVTLPGGFQLPVCLVTEVWIEYDTAVQESDASADAQTLSQFARAYLLQQMVAGSIQSGREALTESEGALLLKGNYDCLEMIGQSRNEEIIGTDG